MRVHVQLSKPLSMQVKRTAAEDRPVYRMFECDAAGTPGPVCNLGFDLESCGRFDEPISPTGIFQGRKAFCWWLPQIFYSPISEALLESGWETASLVCSKSTCSLI